MVGNFEPWIVMLFLKKYESFCAYKIGNFLNLKNCPFILAQPNGPQWPFFTNHSFHCTPYIWFHQEMIGNDIIFLDTCMFLTHVYNCHDNKRISSDPFHSSILYSERRKQTMRQGNWHSWHTVWSAHFFSQIFLNFWGRVTNFKCNFLSHFLMKS